MFFCQKTVLQSVVACKGSDNLWLELFTKEVHASRMFLSTAHDLYGFNHVYTRAEQNIYPCNKRVVFCLRFVTFVRLMNDILWNANYRIFFVKNDLYHSLIVHLKKNHLALYMLLICLCLSTEHEHRANKVQFFYVTMLYFLNSIYLFVTISMYFTAIFFKFSYTINQRK